MASFALTLEPTRKVYRIAVGFLFFLQGVTFASWASRIPSIQQQLQLSETALGLALLALPAGSLLSLPFTGWLIQRFGSRRVALHALIFYALFLLCIGFASSLPHLITALVLFGMAGNVSNIAINTQAVGVEARYGRSIMASFHGLWSLAGFAAAGLGTLMIGEQIPPHRHFLGVTLFLFTGALLTYRYLIREEETTEGSSFLVRPDKSLLVLGVIAFCCMICEGAMFDWSGIYFQKVVQAEPQWVGAGYAAFMCTMAGGRFIADRMAHRFGIRRTILFSGALIATGLATAVLFPTLGSALAGFLLVGFGVSSVVPLVYSEAGKSEHLSPSHALSAVSSIGFLGFLAGPPLIGLLAGAFSLQVSFSVIALMGVMVGVIAARGLQRNRS
ncbi:MAG TPA: MFS transporter [Chitinophagaceae bacterium]|jgi:MFS family permease|nr:MFS transporter [Chitinophagaceae bacterium]